MATPFNKKGTTVLFALGPDHISALSDGRGTYREDVDGVEFVHICDGDSTKLFVLGNYIICFVGVYYYCEKAYKMLIEKIGSRVIDKEVLTEVLTIVQQEYVENFVKCEDDPNEYDDFPSGLFIVGFDGEFFVGGKDFEENLEHPLHKTFTHTIDKKEVKFVGCGGGASMALDYLNEEVKLALAFLDEEFEGLRKLKTNEDVSELLAESLTYISWYDECTGGKFLRAEYHLGGSPIIYLERRHVIEEIIKFYVRLDLNDEFCIPAFADFDPDAMMEEFVFRQNLEALLPEKIDRIINLGGSTSNRKALRLLFFKNGEDLVEALEMLKGPPMIEEINGVEFTWKACISKEFFQGVISGWGTENMF